MANGLSGALGKVFQSNTPNPTGAPGDPNPLHRGFVEYADQLPVSDAEANRDSWYEPAHQLRNRSVVIEPGSPTQISGQMNGRKYVQFTNWSGNADTLFYGDSNRVTVPTSSTDGAPDTGVPLDPGGTAFYEQEKYDGDIWVVTDASAGAVLVIVSDPVAGQ